MTTTELIRRPDAPSGVEPGAHPDPSDAAERACEAPFHAGSSASAHPAHDESPGALVALVGVLPGFGPSIILLAGPLVLFALALAGPFLLLVTLVVLLVACAVLVAFAGAIVASPYLLVRRFRRHRLARAHGRAPAVRFVPVHSGRGTA